MQQFKKTPLILVILLSIITSGIYWPIWFLTRRTAFNNLNSHEKLTKGPLIFSIIAIALSNAWSILMASPFVWETPIFDVDVLFKVFELGLVVDLLAMAAAIILTMNALKVRRILIHHYNRHLGMDINFSWMLTFLFQIFYLQYKINELQ